MMEKLYLKFEGRDAKQVVALLRMLNKVHKYGFVGNDFMQDKISVTLDITEEERVKYNFFINEPLKNKSLFSKILNFLSRFSVYKNR